MDNETQELYKHRVCIFIALMNLAEKQDLKVGWSKKHSDGELCFGGGWIVAWIVAPSGLQARYHIKDNVPIPARFEKKIATVWNEKDENLNALAEISKQ